jgi:hypothetical protein
LGGPNERVRARPGENDTVETFSNPSKDERLREWYYSSGIIGTFDRDRLTAIELFAYDAGYSGLLVYSGSVVNDVKLTDSKQTVLRKLGRPTKIESDEVEGDPDVAAVFPAESRYYWRYKDYLIEATFLNEAQSVDKEHHIIFPKDMLTKIFVSK